jgi:hypothetical protein
MEGKQPFRNEFYCWTAQEAYKAVLPAMRCWKPLHPEALIEGKLIRAMFGYNIAFKQNR